MQAKGADWNFKTEKLTVDGQVYQLVDAKKREHCRRLILQEPLTIPARSQLNVSTMVVYPTYSFTWLDGEKADERGWRDCREMCANFKDVGSSKTFR